MTTAVATYTILMQDYWHNLNSIPVRRLWYKSQLVYHTSGSWVPAMYCIIQEVTKLVNKASVKLRISQRVQLMPSTICEDFIQNGLSFIILGLLFSVFEQIALSILNACYVSNVESTMQLLVMERRSFGMISCIMMAAEGNCKHFMEHQACQEYLDRVWAHTLVIKKSSGRVGHQNAASF